MGYNLADAARESGISRSYIYQIERGESQPTIDKLQALAGAYKTTVGYLIGETKDEYLIKLSNAYTVLTDAIARLG